MTAEKGVAGASTRIEGILSGKKYQMQGFDWGKTIPPLDGSLPRVWGTLMHVGNIEGGGTAASRFKFHFLKGECFGSQAVAGS